MSDKPHLFLVDDDEEILMSASFMLRHAGYVVKTFSSGDLFLDAVTPDDAGCVLLDVRMPGRDGLQVQAELQHRGVALPVIILTGHGDVALAVRAMKAGAADFIEKPYEKAALLAAIDNAVEPQRGSQSQRELQVQSLAKINRLTPRERDVLNGLVEGQTNKAIGAALNIASRTVEIHRANVMRKLETESLSATLKIAFLADVRGGEEA